MDNHFSTSTSENTFPKLKRAVIKEEFVALLGDHVQALILEQFFCWKKRNEDFDELAKQNLIPSAYGDWICVSAKELKEALMLDTSTSTIHRHVKSIIDQGYLESRQNPDFKTEWKSTLQYYLNINKIQTDLLELGYVLEGYTPMEDAS